MYDASVYGEKFMNNEKKLFSIGEIAKTIGITRRIILNYEEKGLITYDVKNGENGNRYYTMDTFAKIHTVRNLQKLGLSLDEIHGYLDGTADLMMIIHRLEAIRDTLNLNIEKLYEHAGGQTDDVKKVSIYKQKVYCRTYTAETVAEKTELLRKTALEAARIYGADTTRRMYFIEHTFSQPGMPAFCASVPYRSEGENVVEIPTFSAICMYHHGAYEKLPEAVEKLVKYAEKNRIQILDKCRFAFLEGPPQHREKDKFITQVIVPLKEN